MVTNLKANILGEKVIRFDSGKLSLPYRKNSMCISFLMFSMFHF